MDAETQSEGDEFTITGQEANAFLDALEHPPDDPRRRAMIQLALRLFPDPSKPCTVDINGIEF